MNEKRRKGFPVMANKMHYLIIILHSLNLLSFLLLLFIIFYVFYRNILVHIYVCFKTYIEQGHTFYISLVSSFPPPRPHSTYRHTHHRMFVFSCLFFLSLFPFPLLKGSYTPVHTRLATYLTYIHTPSIISSPPSPSLYIYHYTRFFFFSFLSLIS